MVNRLKEWREKRGLSLAQLGEAVSSSAPQMHRLENTKRKLTVEWAMRLAPVLGVSPQSLLFPDAEEPEMVMVIGDVQAGVWRESHMWEFDDRYGVAVPIPDRMAKRGAFGLEVRGLSMDLVYPPKTVVVCLPLRMYEGELASGKRVVVERRRHDLHEATVKEFRIDDAGRGWLWPRSSHPDFQQPVSLPDAEPFRDHGDTIAITAVVIGSYRPE